MDHDFIEGITNIVIVIFGLFITAFLTGTIIWLIWPVAIPAAFPGLVASGTLASSLSWWQSVTLSWVFNILIRASQTNHSK